RGVVARRHLVPLCAEEPLEPARAQRREGSGRLAARSLERRGELAQRDRLLVLVPLDRVGDPGVLGRQLLAGTDQAERLVVEAGRRLRLDAAELLALAVVRQDGEPRLRVPERHHLTLELVLPLCELGRDEATLARLAEPVAPLPLVARRPLLGLA